MVELQGLVPSDGEVESARLARSRFWAFVAIYSVLSALCLSAAYVAQFDALFGQIARVGWALGPPLVLIYGWEYFWLYLLETALMLAIAYRCARSIDNDDSALLLWSLAGAVGWLVGGVSVYVIALKAF